MPVMVIGDFRAKPESERDVERAFGERLIRREGELAGLRRRAGWAPPSAHGGEVDLEQRLLHREGDRRPKLSLPLGDPPLPFEGHALPDRCGILGLGDGLLERSVLTLCIAQPPRSCGRQSRLHAAARAVRHPCPARRPASSC